MMNLEFASNFMLISILFMIHLALFIPQTDVNYGYGATACLKIQDTFIDGMHDFIMILGNMLESNGTVALGRSVRPLHKK